MRFHYVGFVVLVLVASCGRSVVDMADRDAWRADAEAQCMQSGAVRETAGVVRIAPIEGPGACGAQYPLKVAAFGTDRALGYTEELRPPGSVPRTGSTPPGWGGQTPRYPPQPQSYSPPAQTYAPARPNTGAPMSIEAPGVASAPREYGPRDYAPRDYAPRAYEPRGASARGYEPSIDRPQTVEPAAQPRYAPRADDIPDDAVLPNRQRPAPQQRTYAPPRDPRDNGRDMQRELPRGLPALGPSRGPMSTGAMKTAMSPPATLACPMVSALDKWILEAVQPAAMRWFRQPVVEIKQISAYSCRGMVGNSRPRISEHAFGNALDIAAFVLADGRKVTVKNGWNGAPEESAFLHDVQLAACDRFSTVLGPGYNIYHYDHLHFDLIRRRSGRNACKPKAFSGEIAYAKQLQKSKYANRGDRLTTGSVGPKAAASRAHAIPGQDGFVDDDDDASDVTGSISKNPATPKYAIPGQDGFIDD